MQKAFQVYFDALARYPDVVIKDRLDGMNIMWDVTQPSESFNRMVYPMIHNFPYTKDYFNLDGMLELNGYYIDYGNIMSLMPLLVQVYPAVKDALGIEEALDEGGTFSIADKIACVYLTFLVNPLKLNEIILWRPGAYLIFFGVLVVYWHKHRMMRMLIPAIPMLGNIAGLMLVLYHQSFRYVYFIQLFVLMLAFLTIVCKDERKNGLESCDTESMQQ